MKRQGGRVVVYRWTTVIGLNNGVKDRRNA